MPPPPPAVSFQIRVKNKILQEKIEAQEEIEEANAHPFPPEVRFWTKEDVGHFLTTLGLRQYREAFAEAAVDGDFLLALDANDCADVLGVEHALHSKKLFLAIDKMRPLTATARRKKASGMMPGSGEGSPLRRRGTVAYGRFLVILGRSRGVCSRRVDISHCLVIASFCLFFSSCEPTVPGRLGGLHGPWCFLSA